MHRSIGSLGNLYISDERQGHHKSLACPYTGRVCGLSEPVLVLECPRRNNNPQRILFSKQGVDEFGKDLRKVAGEGESPSKAFNKINRSRISLGNCICPCCGDSLGVDNVVELRHVKRSEENRPTAHTTLCHVDCSESLAEEVEQFWTHIGLFL